MKRVFATIAAIGVIGTSMASLTLTNKTNYQKIDVTCHDITSPFPLKKNTPQHLDWSFLSLFFGAGPFICVFDTNNHLVKLGSAELTISGDTGSINNIQTNPNLVDLNVHGYQSGTAVENITFDILQHS